MNLRCISTALCLFLLASPSLAGNFLKKMDCGSRPIEIDVTTRHGEPDTLLGPVQLSFSHLNRLRYEISLEGDTSFSNGPDLKLAGFIPKLPSPPKEPDKTTGTGSGAVKGEVADTPEEASLAVAVGNANDVREDLTDLLNQAQQSSDHLQARLNDLASVVQQSDSLVATDTGMAHLVAEIKRLRDSIEADLTRWKWPSDTEIGSLRADIGEIQKRLDRLEDWAEEEGKTVQTNYEGAKTDVRHLSEALRALEANGEQRKKYEELRANLERWLPVLNSIGSTADFQQKIPVDCGHPFFKNKTVTYEITRRDRTIADPSKAVTTEKVITVECPSVASITGGVGISGLDDREIKLVSSAGDNNTAVNKFGFGDKGSEQINPMMLISTRLTDCTQYNWHVTAGTVFDIDNPASSVALGYLLGATVSFRDNLFLTGGLQFGRVYRLGGGFNIGDTAPTGVSAPPLEREWDESWVLTASFKIN